MLLVAGACLWPALVQAQWRPYPYRPRAYEPPADVRVLVTPKEAAVYVDGFYSGIADDFDGYFQRLHLAPGDHEVTLYLEGYRTVRQPIHLRPHATFKLTYTMEKLAPGDRSEPPPAPVVAPPGMGRPPRGFGAWPPPPGPGVPMPPATPAPPGVPAAPGTPERPAPPTSPVAGASAMGAIAIEVHPVDSEVLIDDQQWHAPDGEPLLVQVSEGLHHIEVGKEGYSRFSMDVHVRRGETLPINVRLSEERH